MKEGNSGDAYHKFLKEQLEGFMPLDFTGIKLAPAALQHTMSQSCTIIIVM